MYRFVENFIEENHMIQPGDTVLAGVSGGGDSMAMLDILRRFRKKKEFYASGSSYSSSDQGERSGQRLRVCGRNVQKMGSSLQDLYISCSGSLEEVESRA